MSGGWLLGIGCCTGPFLWVGEARNGNGFKKQATEDAHEAIEKRKMDCKLCGKQVCTIIEG